MNTTVKKLLLSLASLGIAACVSGQIPVPPAVTLSWKDNSTNEEKFILYRSEAPSVQNFIKIGEVTKDIVLFVDRPQRGKTYIYAVTASNSAGESERAVSQQVEIPLLAIPTKPENFSAAITIK